MMLWRGWQHLGAYAGERRPGTKSPASVFSVQGGEIVVAEKFLAAKLGPSRRRSRRKCVGVSSIAWPSGSDEDEGRRASPSAIARSRTVVVKPDGSLNDDPVLARLDNTVLIDSEKRAS
jgi:hypothetical protein